MKLIYVCAMMVFAMNVNNANAQDFCKQIRKDISDNKLLSDYASPFTWDNVPPVRVKRSISTDPEAPFDNYTIIFTSQCGLDDIYNKTADGGQTEKVEKTLVVTFDDNSRLTDDSTDISHDFSQDRTEAIRSMFLPLNESMVNDFSSKKIVKFSLAGKERLFPADSANAVMQYMKCIKSVK
jgi:hypothetical protein